MGKREGRGEKRENTEEELNKLVKSLETKYKHLRECHERNEKNILSQSEYGEAYTMQGLGDYIKYESTRRLANRRSGQSG